MNARYSAVGVMLLLIVLLPSVVHGAVPLVPACEGPNCKFSDFIQLIKNVMNFLLMIAIPLFAILFSWAGFLMITAGGNTSKISKARGIMTTALIGFGVALAAYLIVNLLTNFFLKGSPDARDILQSESIPIYELV